MASINGLELKNVKSFNGHEGECYQGNLYLNGKKIGFWSQDSWGGPDEYWFEPELHINEWKFNELVSAKHPPVKYSGHEIPINLDILMIELLALRDIESRFKKFTSPERPIMVSVTFTDGTGFVQLFSEAYDKEIINEIFNEEEGIIDSLYQIDTINIYRKPEDFNIGEPFKLEDIVA